MPAWQLTVATIWVNGMLATIAFERAIVRRLRYAFWRRWRYDPEDSKTGMQPAANLINIAVTQLVAFAVYLLRDPHPSFAVGLLYFTISLLPILGLVGLIWGRVPMKSTHSNHGLAGRPIHAYDCASVGFAKFAFVTLLLVQAYTLTAYAQETFPTQFSPKKLEFLGAQPGEFTEQSNKKGEPKVVASFELIAPEMPDPVVIPISQLERMPKDWVIFDVIGLKNVGGHPVETRTQPVLDENEGGKKSVVWQGLDSGTKYRLDIVLCPSKPLNPNERALQVRDVMDSISAGKLLVAKAYLRDQR